jgi:hypothetical protein
MTQNKIKVEGIEVLSQPNEKRPNFTSILGQGWKLKNKDG